MTTTEMMGSNPWVIPGMMGIDDAVSHVWGITKELLRSRTRRRIVVEPRQVAIWWRIRNTRDSLEMIGSYYGLDHCTVRYAREQVCNLMETDVLFRNQVEQVTTMMNNKKYKSLKTKENEKTGRT